MEISPSVNNGGSLWNSLPLHQQQQVLEAYEKSEDESNLISLSAIRSKFLDTRQPPGKV